LEFAHFVEGIQGVSTLSFSQGILLWVLPLLRNPLAFLYVVEISRGELWIWWDFVSYFISCSGFEDEVHGVVLTV